MKKRVLIIVKPILFLLLGLVMFWKVQDVLVPNWSVYGGDMIRAIEDGEVPDFDVLFLGSSHVKYGMSPMKLYDEYGIRSFNLGTSGQPVAGSYFLLEEAFEHHDIGTVFLDASGLFISEVYGGSTMNSAWRYILDNLSFGPLKFHMAEEYAKNDWSQGFLSAIFPIISYHSNWTSLMEEDFYPSSGTGYTMGQSVISLTVAAPSHFTPENIDYAADYIHNFQSGNMTEIVNGSISTESIERTLDTTSISNQDVEYLSRIKQLCDEHNSQLILFKVPTMRPPQWYYSAWTRIKSEMISQIAEQYGLEFWDLQYHTDLSLSLETDTTDGGAHLNSLGAEKASDYIGARLIEQGLAVPKADLVYDEALQKYQKLFNVVKLQTTNDLCEYVDFLKRNGENWSIIIAVADDYTLGFTDEDAAVLSELGLTLVSKGELRDSYIGIISSNETVYEALSDYELKHRIQVPGAVIDITSKNGWIRDPGCSIKVNGTEYAFSTVTGMSIVVYDHETGCVLDASAFSFVNGGKCTRNQTKDHALLGAYASALCLEGG